MHHIQRTLCLIGTFPLDTPGMYGHSWLLWLLRSVLTDIHHIPKHSVLLRSVLADMHHTLRTLCLIGTFPLDTPGMYGRSWLLWLLRTCQLGIHRRSKMQCLLRTFLLDTPGMY